MGTRADFYVGLDKNSEWLGSIAWDGYPDGIDKAVLNAKTIEEFKIALENFSSKRDDWTKPERGWPWPWDDSSITDYAYAFDPVTEKVYITTFQNTWISNENYDIVIEEYQKTEDDDEYKRLIEKYSHCGVDHPDMKKFKNVSFGARSGLIVLG